MHRRDRAAMALALECVREMCRDLAQAVIDADCSWAYGSLLDDAEATTQSYEHADEAPAAVGRVGGLLFAIRERRYAP